MSDDTKSRKANTPEKVRTDTLANDVDDLVDLPVVEEDAFLTGAAADSTDLADKLKNLPRIIRTALLIDGRDNTIHDRLVADIVTLCPGLPSTAAFAATGDPTTARALACELDKRAVADDLPELRHLGDCIRLLTLPMLHDLSASEDYKRVTLSLFNALKRLPDDIDPQLGADAETFCVGWAVLPVLRHYIPRYRQPRSAAAAHASFLGNMTATRRIDAAEASIWATIDANSDDRELRAKATVEILATALADVSQPPATTPHQCVVARLSDRETKDIRLKELMPRFKDVINTPLPLIETPSLKSVRQSLLFEFPYAGAVIDTVLADLVGRATIRLRPTLILSPPGAGKSLFLRRLAEILGVFCWRMDASRADGAVFAGTDRRWNSAEPSHPFLAIARAGHANPLVLIDELEKAGTRSDFGRFWDCLLGFLEPETSSRYPDPVLQTDLDLSHISYLATANSVAGLPGPLLDRFRIISFPQPSRDHVDAIMPSVLADLARQRGLDSAWVLPLDADERAAVASAWPGGSVRHLRRLVELVLRDREARATRN
jgi:ATP-dependent Lon protease